MRKITALAALALASSVCMADIDPEWSTARVWDEEILHAIRLATPRPPVHARNLYHTSAAMYDAWATYDPTARGRFFFEKHAAKDVAAARRETLSYAAYRILKNRFVAGNGPNIAAINAHFDATLLALGYDKNITTTLGNTPAAIGNRIASGIIQLGLFDGCNQQGNYAPNNGYLPQNQSLPFKIPGTTMFQPSRWQPLAFDFLILQNGEVVGASVQSVIGPHWGQVVPFAMTGAVDRDPSSLLYFHSIDPNGPPTHGNPDFTQQAVDLIEMSSQMDPDGSPLLNISPSVWGNSPLGSYEMNGYGLNPVTGQPYPDHFVNTADYQRAVAEIWADGPDSETPPGHWHVLANEVSDEMVSLKMPLKVGGVGAAVARLEWDVKLYLAIGGANHDAAVAAWGRKGYYDSARPISFIRYMAQLGQSSSPKLPSYHPNGLPLIPGLIELVTPEDVLPGARFEGFAELTYEPLSGEPDGVDTHEGKIAIRTWLGGFFGGVTGVATEGPLPGHIHRNGGGWNMGGFTVPTDDSPGVLNPGITTKTIRITEIRLDQPGQDTDQYVEISGPPEMSLDGLTYIVLGDEVQAIVPDPNGRIQNVIDLGGHAIGANGTFVIGAATLSLVTPDALLDRPFRKISNCTHMLVAGFSGSLGDDLDFFDDGDIEITPWTGVIDSIALRRSGVAAGIYSATEIGPDDAKNQLYGVGWELAERWMPYQASNFVTPPFPGYTSGHSTFSRAAAEAMARFTGSPYFPTGDFAFVMPAGWSKFEDAPSAEMTLTWVSYYDAADEAGISRLYGGIHPAADDLPARIIGAKVGKRAVGRAIALYRGQWQAPDINLDDIVNGADLAYVLGNWGNAGATDLNGDGTTDGADLAIVLGYWGTQG